MMTAGSSRGRTRRFSFAVAIAPASRCSAAVVLTLLYSVPVPVPAQIVYTDIAIRAGIDVNRTDWSMSAGDMDGDGFADLYIDTRIRVPVDW